MTNPHQPSRTVRVHDYRHASGENRWNFAFANLEQSRLPLWMAHAIVGLYKFGPFGSNAIEGIWAPAWQPLYTSVNYADRRYAGQYSVAGAVNLLPPSGGRFDLVNG